MYGAVYRNANWLGQHSYKPGTRGEEVFFEVKKHEQLVSHYETAVKGGETDLAPRLEQLQLDLAMYRKVESAVSANSELANASAVGQIDASPRFNYSNKPIVTSAEARAAVEPKDGKFADFTEYKIAVRADWKPLPNTTYELEGISVRTGDKGRVLTVSGNCLLYTSPSPRDRG